MEPAGASPVARPERSARPAFLDGPDHLLASDQDRQRIADRLHAATAEGRLSLGELEERLDAAYSARTYGDLVPLVRDLPVARTTADPVRAEYADHVADTGPSVSIAVMSGSNRAGEWVVPAQHTAFAWMGGVELDLCHARFAASRVTITAVAIMGGVEITVPHDMDVEVDGFGLMGDFDRGGAGRRDGGPRVRVTGFALMGGVSVTRADPPELPGPDGTPPRLTKE